MKTQGAKHYSIAAALVAIAAAVTTSAGITPASARPALPDGHCVIDAHSRDRTVNSLRFHCTSRQIVELYKNAPLGTPPTAGKHRLYLLPVSERNGRLGDYRDAKQFGDLQSNLGDALTFGVGPQGQPWVYKNYITGLDAGGPLVYAPQSFVDHKPAWSADFVRDFAGLPVSTHEYRQLTPTVWIGRDFLGPGTVSRPPRQASAIAIA